MSRGCFIPYAPDYYLNQNAIEFGNDLNLDVITYNNPVFKNFQGHKRDRKQSGGLLKRCIDIIENSEDGNRHNSRLKAGRLLGGFIAGGLVDEEIAVEQLSKEASNNTSNPGKARKEILQAIEYGKREPITSFNGDGAYDSEFEETNLEQKEAFFWDEVSDRNGSVIYKVRASLFIDWLVSEGFFRYDRGDKVFHYARVNNNVVKTYSSVEIWGYTASRVKERFGNDMLDVIQKYSIKFTGDKDLVLLPERELNLTRDPMESALIYFKNTVVKVSAEGVETFPYSKLEKPIWSSSIINRDFKEGASDSDFAKFMENVFSENNHLASRTMLGYLLHKYKDQTKAFAIILNDKINGGGPNGGAGKGLIVKAISQIRNTVVEDGKTFNPKAQFSGQTVDYDTEVFSIDDAKEGFDFETLFSIITEGFSIERKYGQKFNIPFDISAKIVITTNYAIPGTGNSHDRRKREFELLSYYGAKRTPISEFGKPFFTNWTISEWSAFDNYMLSCIQDFLKEGLLECQNKNLKINKLISNVGISFIEFMEEYRFVGGEFQARVLKEQFMAFASIYRLSDKMLRYKVETWCSHFGLNFYSYRGRERGTFYRITNRMSKDNCSPVEKLIPMETAKCGDVKNNGYKGRDPNYFCPPERA